MKHKVLVALWSIDHTNRYEEICTRTDADRIFEGYRPAVEFLILARIR